MTKGNRKKPSSHHENPEKYCSEAQISSGQGQVHKENLFSTDEASRSVITASPLAMIALDREGRVMIWNPAAEVMFGWQREEVLGLPLKTVTTEGEEEADSLFKKSLDEAMNVSVETKRRRKDGSVIDVRLFTSSIHDAGGDVVGSMSILEDITQQKKAMEAFRESVERYQIAERAVGIGGFEWNVATGEVILSPSMETLFGISSGTSDMKLGSLFKMLQRNDRYSIRRKITEAFQERMPALAEQFRICLPSKEVRWFDGRGLITYDEEGYPLKLTVVCLDVTRIKRIEEELKRAKELSDALNRINDLISSSFDFGEIMKQTVSEAGMAMGSETAGIMLRENGYWVPKFVCHFPARITRTRLRDEDLPEVILAVKSKDPVFVSDVCHDERVEHQVMERHAIKSIATIPITAGKEVIGMLGFTYHSAPVAFVEADVDFLTKLSATISLAQEKKRLFQDLQLTAEALKRSDTRIRAILHGITDCFLAMDREWRIVDINLQLEAILGKKRYELVGKVFWEVFPELSDSELYFEFNKAMKENIPVHSETFLGIGPVKWIETHAYPSEEGLSVYIRNITRRKETEEELRNARDALELKVEERTAEILHINRALEKEINDRKMIEIALNKRVKKLHCLYAIAHTLSGEQKPFVDWWDDTVQEIVDFIPLGWQFPKVTGARIVLDSREFRTYNYRETARSLNSPILVNGVSVGFVEVCYLEEMAQRDVDPFQNEERVMVGTIAELLGNFVERRETRDMLRESEDRYRRLSQEFSVLLDGIPDDITLLSRDLKVVWANKSAVSQIKREPGDIIGQHCFGLWENCDTACKGCPAEKCFETGELESGQFSNPEGRVREVNFLPLKDEEGRVKNVIFISRDITERLKLELEAIRSAKLASLGELAAGVAHEINNPINSIINYAQILVNKGDRKRKEYEFTKEIVKEGERVASIVRGLLAFARDTKDVKGPVSLEHVITSTLVMIDAQMRRDGIILKVQVDPDLPDIVANVQQLQQVFLNIINNARYGLNQKYPGVHEDKILEITSEGAIFDGRPHVRISFCDHGTGIPASIITRVKDPFFSTKPANRGTGLGLSISNSIVTDHGGRLTISSVEGEYTRVVVELPVQLNPHHP